MPDKTNTIVNGVSTAEPIAMLMSAFLSIAYYGVIELNVRIFTTFKRRRGLYFWSLLVSTWGVAFNCTGYILKFFQVIHADILCATLIVIGWTCMVTGQSIVLYSRLHLVLFDDAKIRAILILIITNAIACHIPVSVLVYGVNSSDPLPFLRPYEIYERVQLTVFAGQEIFISGVYIYYTLKFLGPAEPPPYPHAHPRHNTNPRRTVMKQLILVNALIIAMDIVIVSLQYTGFYDVQTSFKAAAYSVKLRLEFDILNHLLKVSQTGSRSATASTYLGDGRDGTAPPSEMGEGEGESEGRPALARRNTAPACSADECNGSFVVMEMQQKRVSRGARQGSWDSRGSVAGGRGYANDRDPELAQSSALAVRFKDSRF